MRAVALATCATAGYVEPNLIWNPDGVAIGGRVVPIYHIPQKEDLFLKEASVDASSVQRGSS